MAPSTDRQQYRALVAEVAARAKALLPQAVNGRIESAVKLVLLHDIEPQADGTIEVGSSSDPLKTYRLQGTACECQDFTRGQAPEGWCAHRIAANLKSSVERVLARAPQVPDILEPWPDNDAEAEPEEPIEVPCAPTPPAPLPEAPASVNVRLHIAGREVQWTLRDTDETRLAVRLEALLQRYPVPQGQAQPRSPQQHNALAMHRPITGLCKVHNVEMTLNDKHGRQWYSHRTADGQWCKGK